MSFQLTASGKPGCLHVTVTGPRTVESVTGHLRDVCRIAEAEAWLTARVRP